MKHIVPLHRSQHISKPVKSHGVHKYPQIEPIMSSHISPSLLCSLWYYITDVKSMTSRATVTTATRGYVSSSIHMGQMKGSTDTHGYRSGQGAKGEDVSSLGYKAFGFKGIPGGAGQRQSKEESGDDWANDGTEEGHELPQDSPGHRSHNNKWNDYTDVRENTDWPSSVFSGNFDDNDTKEWISKGDTVNNINDQKLQEKHFQIYSSPVVMPSRPTIPRPLSTAASVSESYIQQVQIDHRSYKDTSPLPQVPWLQDSKKTYLDDAERVFGRKEEWYRIPDHGSRIRLILLLKEFITDTVKNTNDIRTQTLNERRNKLGRLTSEFASYMVIGADDPQQLRKWRVPLSAAEIVKQEEERDMKPYIAESQLREMTLRSREDMGADQYNTVRGDGVSDNHHATDDLSILNNIESGGAIDREEQQTSTATSTTTAHIAYNTNIDTRPIMDSLRGQPAIQDMDIDTSMNAISPYIPMDVLKAEAINEQRGYDPHSPYNANINETGKKSEPYYHQYPFLRKRVQEDKGTLDSSLVDWTHAYFPADSPSSFDVPSDIDIRYNNNNNNPMEKMDMSMDSPIKGYSYNDDYDSIELDDAKIERTISEPKAVLTDESRRLIQEKKRKQQRDKRITKLKGKGRYETADADGIRISRKPSLSLRQSLATKINQNLAIFDGEGLFYKRTFNSYPSEGHNDGDDSKQRDIAMLDSEGVPKAIRPKSARVTTVTDVRRCILGSPAHSHKHKYMNSKTGDNKQQHLRYEEDSSPSRRYYGLSDDAVVKVDWNTSVRSRRGFTVPGLMDDTGPRWHRSNERLVRISRGESPDGV